MPDLAYVTVALAVAVGITVALRTLPFLLKGIVADSALLADLGRWMPLGAMAILALYCVTTIDLTHPQQALSPIAGLTTTVGMHWWRRNAVLSIVTGTTVCLLFTHAVT